MYHLILILKYCKGKYHIKQWFLGVHKTQTIIARSKERMSEGGFIFYGFFPAEFQKQLRFRLKSTKLDLINNKSDMQYHYGHHFNYLHKWSCQHGEGDFQGRAWHWLEDWHVSRTEKRSEPPVRSWSLTLRNIPSIIRPSKIDLSWDLPNLK